YGIEVLVRFTSGQDECFAADRCAGHAFQRIAQPLRVERGNVAVTDDQCMTAVDGVAPASGIVAQAGSDPYRISTRAEPDFDRDRHAFSFTVDDRCHCLSSKAATRAAACSQDSPAPPTLQSASSP